MLEYTITEGQSFFQDQFNYNYTYKESYEIGSPCGVCEGNPPEYQGTYETYSTYSQSSNGDWTQSRITKYRDNGPKICPYFICGEGENTYEVGGYARCNSYELQAYTINLANGKRTENYNVLTLYAAKVGDQGCQTTSVKNFPRVWSDPMTESDNQITTTTQTTKSSYFITTNSQIGSTKLTNNGSNIYQTDYTYNGITNKYTLSTKTITVLTARKGNTMTVGFRDSLGWGNLGPINARNTVIYLTNNDVVWYRTDNKPVHDAKKQISQAFNSIQGIGKSTIIKYQIPVLKDASSLIGSYNCSYKDENFGNNKNQIFETLSSTIEYVDTVYTFTEHSRPDIVITQFPAGSKTALNLVSTTSKQPATTKYSFNIKNYRTYSTSGRVLKKYNVKASILNWNYLKEGESYSLKSTYSPIYSTHGQCVEGSTTRNDNAQYLRIQNCYWADGTNNGGLFEFHSPAYLGGMVSPENLTSYGVVADLGGKVFKGYNIGGYIVSVIPNIYYPLGTDFLNNWTVKLSNSEGTLNYLISSSIVSAIEHSSTYREEKNTLTSTTKYAWKLQGQKPTTYFITHAMQGGDFQNYIIYIHNFKNTYTFSIGDPNVLYGGEIYMNIGKYRNDGDQNNPITRILYPGRYLKIGNTTATHEANNIEYKNIVDDNSRDLYLPLCDEVIGQSISSLGEGNVYFNHPMVELDVLSEALQIGFGAI